MKIKRHVIVCPRCNGYGLVPQGLIRRKGFLVPCRDCGYRMLLTPDTPKFYRDIKFEYKDDIPIDIREIWINDKLVSFKSPEKFIVRKDGDSLVAINDFWGIVASTKDRLSLKKQIVQIIGVVLDEYIFSTKHITQDAKDYAERINDKINSIS